MQNSLLQIQQHQQQQQLQHSITIQESGTIETATTTNFDCSHIDTTCIYMLEKVKPAVVVL